jgi:hypothetical protein
LDFRYIFLLARLDVISTIRPLLLVRDEVPVIQVAGAEKSTVSMPVGAREGEWEWRRGETTTTTVEKKPRLAQVRNKNQTPRTTGPHHGDHDAGCPNRTKITAPKTKAKQAAKRRQKGQERTYLRISALDRPSPAYSLRLARMNLSKRAKKPPSSDIDLAAKR